ncbi:PepSY-associated TM helix domain-containing protein [Massilia pseudoviolaceinigra]|uniref:PepSY-associated TM helix domain-containing protein n=1 Tax=Massilia pseudoviolaceinigra TaxID=3057165 RepID=UPI00279658FB|nr:PepSY-associated TM helix domain-containing protein [Massilia sp. CCM 9206]MDQ1921470.1 PepSY-associated TM helix domain-containing protein [Massilia sp. CCM 9206]
MKENLRQSMAWLHTWSGLLVCWVLLLIFAGGTASYYQEEITLWMEPELHGVAAHKASSVDAADMAVKALQQRAPDAQRWFINLPTERRGAVRIAWTAPPPPEGAPRKRQRLRTALIDPVTGAAMAEPRDTRGGEFIYRLHFDLHYMPPLTARWIVGFCAMFMLVSIISGVITHKRIFKDFFTFRPNKGQRSWLDAHNATAVLALPFHLMITYTGLVTLMFMYMPGAAQVAYKGDRDRFTEEVFPSAGKPAKKPGEAAVMAPLRPMLEQAERHWGGSHAGAITVNHPNHANASVSITRAGGRELSYKQPAMQFDAVNGALLASAGDQLAPPAATHGVMYGLHVARFADPLLRALFFLSGLAGYAMVATGAILWAVKSRQTQAKALKAGASIGVGTRLVEALNIGAVAGLPIAFACYFWANRLLPVVMEKRAENEIAVFFAAWGAAALLAQMKPDRAMWRLQLAAGAFLFGAIPLLNVFTTSSHLGVTLLNGPSAVAWFDITVLALGLLLGYGALRLGRGKVKRNDVKAPAVSAGVGAAS